MRFFPRSAQGPGWRQALGGSVVGESKSFWKQVKKQQFAGAFLFVVLVGLIVWIWIENKFQFHDVL